MHRARRTFPLSAIVGQEALKTGLLLAAIDHRVGGVLIRGSKGTAKSTAVRALGELLPELDVVADCRFGCDPEDMTALCESCARTPAASPRRERRRPRIVELPVSATEDRVVGTLDLEHALKTGERRFEPGLLADANRGILYIDEVNLLDDHLVDVLLDVAASGVNIVEREGVAFSHPARFVLVGTMNPEEGELRPQLLDRFGLCVDVTGIVDPAARVEVLKRRQHFEDDPDGFAAEWAADELLLADRLAHARRSLSSVGVGGDILRAIAELCSALNVDGHRADLVMARAAAALAALQGDPAVTLGHVRAVAPLVLAHRMRRSPFDDTLREVGVIDTCLAVDAGAGDSSAADVRFDGSAQPADPGVMADSESDLRTEAPAAASGAVDGLLEERERMVRRAQDGRRQRAGSRDRSGHYVRSAPLRPGEDPDVALDATIRAAAPYQSTRTGDLAILLQGGDLQRKVRSRRVGTSIVFCVDASGSMGAANRMQAAKAAVLELLIDAYQRRDRVGVVTFRGDGAEILLPPTGSVELAHLRLRTMATGGSTPLARGLLKALEVLQSETKRDADVIPWLVLVTDGRANVGLGKGLGSDDARAAAHRIAESGVKTLVIDTAGAGGGAPAREIARAAGAEYVRLSDLDGASLTGTVRSRIVDG